MPPLHLLIKPASSLCNMACTYCFYTDEARHREGQAYGLMQEDTLELLVRRAFEYATEEVSFTFQGGEPTLAGLDFYRRLVQLQATYRTGKLRVYNAIQTNGYALDTDWADFFAEHDFLVGLSIDGTREAHNALRMDATGHGTYDTVVRSVALLEDHYVRFNILCVVHRLVAKQPQKVYHQLKAYRYLQFIPCLDALDGTPRHFSLTPQAYATFLNATFDLYYQDFLRGNYVSIRNFDNYIHLLLGHAPESCAMRGVCTCSPVVEADGRVFPCDFYALDSWQLGCLQDTPLRELLTGPVARRFVETSQQVAVRCRTCPYYTLCRGGCRRDREFFPHGAPGENRWCDSYRAFFRRNLPRLMHMAQCVQNTSDRARQV